MSIHDLPSLVYSVSAPCWRRDNKKKCNPYHNGITGSSGEIDVVRVGGDSTVSLLDVACNILTYTLNALASTIGPLNT